ncbi:undecaprenyl-diphosphatase UppP [Patescibacteria group bacterium]|nr:undecaprenyl-diphosphatase UppP [Patescibacteria group bacterium]
MDLLQVIILSMVEGFTEFLPISSTGHLVLTSNLLGIEQTEFVKSFEIIIQLGAILAIILLYWKGLLQNKEIWKRVFIAFLPTAVIGFLLYKFIKNFLLGNEIVTISALFLGGIILILFELIHKEKDLDIKKVENLSLKNSFLIGVFQSLAVIPGVSRAAATILGALFLKTKRKAAVEFSFLLAIPTMLAATGLDIVKSNVFSFNRSELIFLAVGFFGSFLFATVAVKFLLNFIKNHTFISFGIYRIILSVLYFWLVIK